MNSYHHSLKIYRFQITFSIHRSSPKPTISAKTGSVILAIATFDVNSVRNWIERRTMNRIANGGNDFNPDNALPRSSDMPDDELPSARAKPPPKILKISKCQVNFVRNFLR